MTRPDSKPNQPATPNRRDAFWRDCFRSALHARILMGDHPVAASAAASEYADAAFVAARAPAKTVVPKKDRPVPDRPAVAQVGAVRAHPTS